MTDVQEKPTLTFDGKNYVIEDLSEQARYLVGQIQDLNQQSRVARQRLDQLEVAKNGFTALLKEELENPPAEEVPAE